MINEDDLYRVEGSKVWMSPTARQYAEQYFGPGKQGEIQMAQYLRLRHQMQTAALTSPTAPMSDFSAYLGAPSGLPQEYEAREANNKNNNCHPIWRCPTMDCQSIGRSTRRNL